MKITGPFAEQEIQDFYTEPSFFHGKLVPRVWVLVADRKKAFVYRKDGQALELVARFEPDVESIPTTAQKTRGHVGAGNNKAFHSSDPMDRENHHDDKVFVKALAQWLSKADEQDIFDELVLAAPARITGDFRECLEASLAGKIKKVFTKDLVNMPKDELENYQGSLGSVH